MKKKCSQTLCIWTSTHNFPFWIHCSEEPVCCEELNWLIPGKFWDEITTSIEKKTSDIPILKCVKYQGQPRFKRRGPEADFCESSDGWPQLSSSSPLERKSSPILPDLRSYDSLSSAPAGQPTWCCVISKVGSPKPAASPWSLGTFTGEMSFWSPSAVLQGSSWEALGEATQGVGNVQPAPASPAKVADRPGRGVTRPSWVINLWLLTQPISDFLDKRDPDSKRQPIHWVQLTHKFRTDNNVLFQASKSHADIFTQQ